MKLYVQHMAPMEAELIQKAEEEEEEGSVVAAKNTRIIAAQVRGTLCGFCKDPTDADEQMIGAGTLIRKAFMQAAVDIDVRRKSKSRTNV